MSTGAAGPAVVIEASLELHAAEARLGEERTPGAAGTATGSDLAAATADASVPCLRWEAAKQARAQADRD